jgi:HEAT repeat protein
MIRALLSEADPNAWIVAIRAIGAFGYTDLVGGLPRLVDSEYVGVALAAAETLGRLGGLEAVEKLFEVANKLIVDARLRHVARHAIGQIQARHRGGKGQLSITAGNQEGELAFAGDGGLALPEKTEDL